MSSLFGLTRPLLLIVLNVAAVLTAAADDEDRTYFEALRQRRLWSLAEVVLQRELNAHPDPGVERTELMIEFIGTLSAHASDSSRQADRDELWSRARSILKDEFESRLSRESRLLLTLQSGFLTHDELTVNALLVELFPFDNRVREQQRGLIGKAIRELTELDQQLGTFKLEVPAPQSGTQRERPRIDLHSLRRDVQWRLAEALLLRSLMLPLDSPDRASDFLSTEQTLRRVTGGPRDQTAVWKAHLVLARLQRERGDPSRAKGLLESLDPTLTPSSQDEERICELAECLLDLERPADAADLLRKHRSVDGLQRRVDYLVVVSLLPLAELARGRNEQTLARDLMTEAELRARPSDPASGNYWNQRSQAAVEFAQSQERFGREVAAELHAGRGLYASGEIPGAFEAFQRAYETHRKRGVSEDSFEIGLTVARLMVEQQKFDDAVAHLNDLLMTHPDQKQRADADFLRAICRGRLFQAAPQRETRDQFLAALEAHRTQYPESKTSVDAERMLTQLREQLKAAAEMTAPPAKPDPAPKPGAITEPLRHLSLAEKKAHWRKIEQANAAGTADWVHARSEVISLCLARGERDEAVKLVRVTRLLYPELGSPESRARFEKVAAQVARPVK